MPKPPPTPAGGPVGPSNPERGPIQGPAPMDRPLVSPVNRRGRGNGDPNVNTVLSAASGDQKPVSDPGSTSNPIHSSSESHSFGQSDERGVSRDRSSASDQTSGHSESLSEPQNTRAIPASTPDDRPRTTSRLPQDSNESDNPPAPEPIILEPGDIVSYRDDEVQEGPDPDYFEPERPNLAYVKAGTWTVARSDQATGQETEVEATSDGCRIVTLHKGDVVGVVHIGVEDVGASDELIDSLVDRFPQLRESDTTVRVMGDAEFEAVEPLAEPSAPEEPIGAVWNLNIAAHLIEKGYTDVEIVEDGEGKDVFTTTSGDVKVYDNTRNLIYTSEQTTEDEGGTIAATSPNPRRPISERIPRESTGLPSSVTERILKRYDIPVIPGHGNATVEAIKARTDSIIGQVGTVTDTSQPAPGSSFPELRTDPTSESPSVALRNIRTNPQPGESAEEIWVFPNTTSKVFEYTAVRSTIHEPAPGAVMSESRFRHGKIEIAVTEFNGGRDPLIEVSLAKKGNLPSKRIGTIGGAAHPDLDFSVDTSEPQSIPPKDFQHPEEPNR